MSLQKTVLSQTQMIAGVISGSRHEEHWNLEKAAADFYDLKGDVESLLAVTGKLSEFRFEKAEIDALHPGQTAAIYKNDQLVGYIGALTS